MDDFGPEADFDPTLAEENPDDWALIEVSEVVQDAERRRLTLEDLPLLATRPHIFWQTYMAMVGAHSNARLFAGNWRNVDLLANYCHRIGAHDLAELVEDLSRRLRDMDPNQLDAHPEYGSRLMAVAGDADPQLEEILWDRRIEAAIVEDYDHEDRPILRAANSHVANEVSGRRLLEDYIRPLLADPAIERRNRERDYQARLEEWRRESRAEGSLAQLHREFLNHRNIDGVYPQLRMGPTDQIGMAIAELSHGGRDYFLVTYRDKLELVDVETGDVTADQGHTHDWGTDRKKYWTHRWAPYWSFDPASGEIIRGKRRGLIGRLFDRLGFR